MEENDENEEYENFESEFIMENFSIIKFIIGKRFAPFQKQNFGKF